jgi:hypothetical protein
VRKIISILIALGLVLGFSVMATPVSAAVSGVSVSVAPNCAGAAAAYNITFNISASLTQGVHSVCIEFPAGTTVPTTFATGKIKIETLSVFGTEVTVTGQKVCFLVPKTFETTDNSILVEFAADAGLKNPLTPGTTYKVKVNTSRAPDSTPVESAAYTIAPAISVYGFEWDSNPTYPGIAVGFVPPFKACGQAGYPGAYQLPGGATQNAFNLTLAPTTVGCAAPCTQNVTINVTLTAAPAGSTVTLNLTNTPTWGGTLTPTAPSFVVGSVLLGVSTTIEWAGLIHFDTVGTYQICFDVICPAGTPDCNSIPPCVVGAVSVVHKCYDFKVYQWKDAAKITLQEKWNLISLPLVPLAAGTGVSAASAKFDDLVLSIPAADRAEILSIWNYDCTAKTFSTWGPGFTSLTTMADGKAYWVRVDYPLTSCGNISWWVFGTAKPMPPASPAQYSVCAGWNMVGFLGTSSLAANSYLWNWGVTQPVIYGWNQGCWNVQGWSLVAPAGLLNPGQGYWMAFGAAGAIYVP